MTETIITVCSDVANDVFDADEETCALNGDDFHVCIMEQDHIATRAHECECGVTW